MIAAFYLAANFIGGIPLIIGMLVHSASDPQALSRLAANPSNLGLAGLNQNLMLFLMLFPFIVGLVTFALLIKPLHGRTFRQTITGAPRFRWNRFFASSLVWVVLSVLYFVVYRAVEPSNFRLNNTSTSLIWLAVISVVFIPFQALLEEVLFRGYLMQSFTVLSVRYKLAAPAFLAAIITSVLFGVMHSWNPEIKEYGFFTMIPQYILFGLIFAITTICDDGIEIAAGAHAANNVFLSIFITNSSSTLQTPAMFEQVNIKPWTEFTALVIVSVLFLIILGRIFRFQKYKALFGNYDQAHNVPGM